ncbi:MAG: hypothetical protein WA151_13985, partial [Desulfatirhabdiaceae bacterium]
ERMAGMEAETLHRGHSILMVMRQKAVKAFGDSGTEGMGFPASGLVAHMDMVREAAAEAET